MIEVDPRLMAALGRLGGGVTIVAEPAQQTEHTNAAIRASLHNASIDLMHLEDDDGQTPSFISRPTPTRRGYAISIDYGDLDTKIRLRIPDIIREHLQTAGITDATLTTDQPSAPQHPFTAPSPRTRARGPLISEVPNLVSLALFAKMPPLRGYLPRIPETWINLVQAWLTRAETSETWVSAGSLDLWPSVEVAERIRATVGADPFQSIRVAAGDPSAHLYCAGVSVAAGMIRVGFAGEDWTAQERSHLYNTFIEIARAECHAVSYAVTTLESHVGELAMHPRSAWGTRNIDPFSGRFKDFVDEVAIGVFPYQILNPNHQHRLAPDAATRALRDGRVELFIGTLDQWLGPERERVEHEGEVILDRCLMGRDELKRDYFQRPKAEPNQAGRIWPGE